MEADTDDIEGEYHAEQVDSMEQSLRDLVSPLTEEKIICVARFFPGNRWKHPDPLHAGRIIRRLSGRGRLDDRLATFLNVMVVTPTRVLVYGASTRTRRFALTKKFAEWQRTEITTSSANVSFMTGGGAEGQALHHQHVLRLTFTTPDGRFEADLEAGTRPLRDLSKQLVDELTKGA
jgi:hypothetical protein